MQIKPARGLIAFVLRRTGFGGVTLPRAVYLLPERMGDHALIAHERVHVEQMARMGVVRFYLTYLWQWVRHGYQDHPMEREARAAER